MWIKREGLEAFLTGRNPRARPQLDAVVWPAVKAHQWRLDGSYSCGLRCSLAVRWEIMFIYLAKIQCAVCEQLNINLVVFTSVKFRTQKEQQIQLFNKTSSIYVCARVCVNCSSCLGIIDPSGHLQHTRHQTFGSYWRGTTHVTIAADLHIHDGRCSPHCNAALLVEVLRPWQPSSCFELYVKFKKAVWHDKKNVNKSQLTTNM